MKTAWEAAKQVKYTIKFPIFTEKMKILRLQPRQDVLSRFNYQVNYGVWDAIEKVLPMTTIALEDFDGDTTGFDFVFLPPVYRLHDLLQVEKIKSGPAKIILFDNDSCYRSFSDPIYLGIDFVFYRILDRNKKEPIYQPSAFLPFSINPNLYTPVFGGSGVSFNCAVNHFYPLRQKISRFIPRTRFKGDEYISHLQSSAAAIHTNSEISDVPRGKLLEFAACGCEIFSNRMPLMSLYFPDELIHYFDTVPQLVKMVRDFEPDIEKQKALRQHLVECHSDSVRADFIIRVLVGV